jgi:hypothetical protein
MNAQRSAALVRGWVSLYTRGLPDGARRDRRDEIEDDLWSQLADGAGGPGEGSLAREILLRLVLGIPADLSWSFEQRRLVAPRPSSVRSPNMDTRLASVLGVVGGAGLLLTFAVTAIYGEAGWSMAGVGMLQLIGVLSATLGLPLAVLVLLATLHEQLPRWVVGVGTAGALVTLLTTLGMYRAIVALPIASLAAIWPLGRIGVLPRWSSWTHLATASAFEAIAVIAFVNPSTIAAGGWIVGLAIGYPLSWLAIGWSLRHGATFRVRPSATA